ncbi:L-cystine transporter [Treponema pedis]|uniref:Sodium:dicarboxylate symporter n=2 Tax=Treponema pedis TaxID=409322 RepID=S6A8V4_9SPIR|nr:cation:dicarboxylase symporter family transporter [Treponema pedis]AGT44484.1 sodium:dicarboxylate symporter [Treponema pedis str. T A4]QOW59800.1 cation:dicarboxylase symporter family transporter [Treponema pedis]
MSGIDQNVILTAVNVIIFAILTVLLIFMKKRNLSFTVRVMTALVLGIIIGVAFQLIYGFGSPVISKSNSWIGIIGSGYVRLLRMIVIPLVFISILGAIINQKTGNLGKTAGRVLAVLLITTAVSAFVGAFVTVGFGLKAGDLQAGEAEQARGALLEKKLDDFSSKPIQQQIIEIIPTNPFYAMTGQGGNSTLATVFFAAMLGIATVQLRRIKREPAEKFGDFVQMLHDIIMRLVQIILRLTPYGVFALMANIASSSNYSDIFRLIKFVLASYAALIIMFIIHLVILALFGINPVKYLKKALEPLMFGFISRSSAGTLPLTVKTQIEKIGVPEGIANLSASLGTSIGQNGCAGIYPAMLAVMIAPSLGISPLDPTFLIKLAIVVTFASFGIAGVGGGATFAALTVLSAMGMPVGLAGLLVAIEPLIDMGRTSLNVNGSIVAGVVTAKTMKELNTEIFNEDKKEV